MLLKMCWECNYGFLSDCDVLQDDCFDSGNSREAQVGDIKLDLPLDEDDYLMPCAQQSQNSTPYMDIIGDTKLTGTAQFSIWWKWFVYLLRTYCINLKLNIHMVGF